MKMLKKLRNKLLVLLMTVISAVMLIAFAVIYLSTYTNVQQERYSQLDKLTSQTYGDVKHALSSDKGIMIKQSFILITVTNGQITDKVSYNMDLPDSAYQAILEEMWNNKNNEGIIEINGKKWQYLITPPEKWAGIGKPEISENGDYKVYLIDINVSARSLTRLLITLAIVWVCLLAVIFFLSLYFANRSIRPIEENLEKQKLFVADASHELKTPLTRIILNGGILKANEQETIKSQEEWLDAILIGADKMNKLVSSLLTLARAEGMGIQTEKHPIDFTALVSDVMQSMEVAAQMKNLHVCRDVEFIEDIYGYEESVRQVFTILYENAVKYADEGGKVEVSVHRTKKGLRCKVKNTGKGIPQKDLPHIFDRFYRADDARSGEENSFGLGLSIAKSVTEQIGGKITAQSTENGWTEFIFTF